MHPIKYGYIQSPHLCYSQIPHTISSPKFMSSLFLINLPCPINTACMYGIIHWSLRKLAVATPTRKNDSPSLSRYLLGVGSGELLPHSCWNDGSLDFVQTLCQEFKSTVALSRSEDKTSQHLDLSSGSYILSASFFWYFSGLRDWGR